MKLRLYDNKITRHVGPSRSLRALGTKVVRLCNIGTRSSANPSGDKDPSQLVKLILLSLRLMAKNITSSPTTYTGNIYELLLYTKTKTRTARGAQHIYMLIESQGVEIGCAGSAFQVLPLSIMF